MQPSLQASKQSICSAVCLTWQPLSISNQHVKCLEAHDAIPAMYYVCGIVASFKPRQAERW